MKPDLHHGDCREVLRGLADESIHACVTDPPYELGFMGRAWDASGIAYGVAMWRDVLRVLKPGGHLLAFGGTRTYHRMTCAIEDAGFEIRDCIAWHTGQGFPKSLDVSKAIDKAAGAVRERVLVPTRAGNSERRGEGEQGSTFGDAHGGFRDLSLPAIPAAREWSGWGTALKPATEPIVVARKPLVGTVAANALEHGTGAINVDGCRVASAAPIAAHHGTGGGAGRTTGAWRETYSPGDAGKVTNNAGRWPPNLLLTHAYDCADTCAPDCPVRLMDGQSGETTSSDKPRHNTAAAHNATASMGKFSADWITGGHTDSGGASRFFPTFRHEVADAPFLYQAKASKADRGEGNRHPTVKPVALMRWLVRLVTPKGGVVLDPFAGSGTTLLAARAEGFASVGIEREADHIAIIRARLDGEPAEVADTPDDQQPQRRQLALFGGA